MQKKIIIGMVLVSFIIALVVPIRAKAENTEWRDFKQCWLAYGYTMEDLPFEYSAEKNYLYFQQNTSNVYLAVWELGVTPNMYWSTSYNEFFIWQSTTNPVKLYKIDSTGKWVDYTSKMGTYLKVSKYSNQTICFYSDVDIIDQSTKNVYWAKTKTENYRFVDWCDDALLNSTASSNESASVIPYSYNSYWHIVRKTSAGKWLLTTIGNSVMADNLSDYTLMYTEDYSKLQVYNLYSGEDVNGYLLNIRQYEYDADGWRLKSFATEDTRDTDNCIIDLGVGSGIDSTKVLAFTSADIYDTGFNLITEATKEYVEPSNPDIPEIDITPTPTNKPNVPNIPDIDISNLNKSLKLQEITTDGFNYNGVNYTWNTLHKEYMIDNNLTDYLVFYEDYNKQLIFVWAFDDFMAQAKNQKSGLRFYSYYYEFITEPNNSSVLPYCFSVYQINSDGTLDCINSLQNEKAEDNHQFSFGWTNPIYEPNLDNIDNFSTYEEYVLNNNLIASNCDIYNYSGVLVKSAVTLNNDLITPDEVPDTEIGTLKYYLYEKLPIIGTVEVFVKKFNVVLESMKESGEPPEIIMNFDNYYGFGGEVNVLDVSWYEDYREPVKAILSAILIIPFILWVYKKGLPEAIGGI